MRSSYDSNKSLDASKNLSVENVELSIKTLNSVLEKYELQSKANKEIISLSRKKVTIYLTAFLTSLLSQMINFGFLDFSLLLFCICYNHLYYLVSYQNIL